MRWPTRPTVHLMVRGIFYGVLSMGFGDQHQDCTPQAPSPLSRLSSPESRVRSQEPSVQTSAPAHGTFLGQSSLSCFVSSFAEENLMGPEAYRKIKQVLKARVCAIKNMKEMYFKTYLSCTFLLFIKARATCILMRWVFLFTLT